MFQVQDRHIRQRSIQAALEPPRPPTTDAAQYGGVGPDRAVARPAQSLAGPQTAIVIRLSQEDIAGGNVAGKPPEQKNCWHQAEQAGHDDPQSTQRLLRGSLGTRIRSIPGGTLPIRQNAGATGAARPNWEQEEALDVDVENLLAKVADNLSVRRAFGTAYEKDGVLIIPVAIVAGGGGGGTGGNRRGNPAADPGSPPEEAATAHDITPQDSGRTETGGGFGGLVLPSGAYVVQGDQVRWVPALDVTIAVLASLSLVRMLARAWTRQRGQRRRP